MKQKIVFNLSILYRNYCVFFNESNTKLGALASDKNGESYFVTDEKELKFLNKIIEMLNKKYVRRRDIVFNNETIARYENRYNHISHFIKFDESGAKPCPYEEYKELYRYYNGPQISCIFRQKKRPQNNNYDELNFGDNPYYSSYSGNNPYGNNPYGNNSYGYNSYDGEYNPYNNYTPPKKKNNVFKKLIISIAGVAVVVSLSFAGYKVLSEDKLPEIVENPQVTNVLETEAQEDIGENSNNSNISSNSNIYSINLEKEYGSVDIIADTEEQKALEDRYRKVQEQLQVAGLENWEISAALDVISIFHGDVDNIDFYYDGDTNQIAFVYGKLPQKVEEVATGDKTITISAEVKRIVDAIEQNEKISAQEKKHIIDTYAEIWCENEQYLDIDELVERYKNLEIHYELIAGGKESSSEYNPSEHVAGEYVHGQKWGDGKIEQVSEINVYDSNSIEESLADLDKTSTFDHETNHINGNFSYYGGSLLNEGYNQLSQPSCDERYKVEQAMVMLFAETFGNETLKEGFYGFDLQGALTNKMVKITGRDQNTVDSEIYQLLEDTDEVLYDSGKDENYKNNSELMARYESIFSRLSEYYEQIHGRKMSENQATNIIREYLTGTRSSNLYLGKNEKIQKIGYDLDTSSLVCEIASMHEEEIKYEIDGYLGTTMNPSYRRIINLDDTNKYQVTPPQIADKDIEYFTR